MLQLHREMNRMFDDMFRGIAPNAPSNENTLIPSMDVSQEEGQLKIQADLPGVSSDNLEIEVSDDNVLTITGKREQEREEEQEGVMLRERSFGSFRRSIQLPEGAETDQIEATFKDGVLHLTCPVPQQVEGQPKTKKIEVKAA
jgi:HSP20 family protein